MWLKVGLFLGAGLISGVFYLGVTYGKRSMAQELLDAAAETQKKTQEVADAEALRLSAEAKQRVLARKLEEQAYAQPADSECGIGVERVRRLNLR